MGGYCDVRCGEWKCLPCCVMVCGEDWLIELFAVLGCDSSLCVWAKYAARAFALSRSVYCVELSVGSFSEGMG